MGQRFLLEENGVDGGHQWEVAGGENAFENRARSGLNAADVGKEGGTLMNANKR
jgi:hypothetical protein